MKRTKEITVFNRLTQKTEIKKLDYFNNVSLKNVVSIELLDNKLFCNLKDGNVKVYSNIHGSWGFPTYL